MVKLQTKASLLCHMANGTLCKDPRQKWPAIHAGRPAGTHWTSEQRECSAWTVCWDSSWKDVVSPPESPSNSAAVWWDGREACALFAYLATPHSLGMVKVCAVNTRGTTWRLRHPFPVLVLGFIRQVCTGEHIVPRLCSPWGGRLLIRVFSLSWNPSLTVTMLYTYTKMCKDDLPIKQGSFLLVVCV